MIITILSSLTTINHQIFSSRMLSRGPQSRRALVTAVSAARAEGKADGGPTGRALGLLNGEVIDNRDFVGI